MTSQLSVARLVLDGNISVKDTGRSSQSCTPVNDHIRHRSMSLFKYTLLQIPGWIILGLLLLWLWNWLEFSAWIAIGILAVWVVKDFILYSFIRTAYESSSKTGTGLLIGSRGIARESLDPQGYIHTSGELWRAEIGPDQPPIPSGAAVRIKSVRGLTLIVEYDHTQDK